jgi:hypothetical protein
MSKATCPVCQNQFTPWRAKKFCSERCSATARKRAQRGPCHGMNQPSATLVASGEKPSSESPENRASPKAMSRDERPLEWRECNEVTWMLIPEHLSLDQGVD